MSGYNNIPILSSGLQKNVTVTSMNARYDCIYIGAQSRDYGTPNPSVAIAFVSASAQSRDYSTVLPAAADVCVTSASHHVITVRYFLLLPVSACVTSASESSRDYGTVLPAAAGACVTSAACYRADSSSERQTGFHGSSAALRPRSRVAPYLAAAAAATAAKRQYTHKTGA